MIDALYNYRQGDIHSAEFSDEFNKLCILENYSIFDFELTDAEMQRMAELHTGQRYENW